MTRNFVLCSDLHGELPKLPSGEFLILAGDLGPNLRSYKEESQWFNDVFFPWLSGQDHKYKIIIAGNHDFVFERQLDSLVFSPEIFYLSDNAAEIGGLKFHGSPRTPQFGEWAFMAQDSTLRHYWDIIPADTQILITHGPPYGIRDAAPRRSFSFDPVLATRVVTETRMESVGSKTLRERLSLLKDLKLHVFGHIHEGYGKSSDGNVWYVNSAYWDGNMRNNNPPIVIDIDIA